MANPIQSNSEEEISYHLRPTDPVICAITSNMEGIMTSFYLIILSGILLLGGCGGEDQGQQQVQTSPADMIVVNAQIFTSNADQPWAEALAVRDERFVYVGSNQWVMTHVGPATEMIDALGRMVTPGFVDNHCHVLWISTLGVNPSVSLHDADSMGKLKSTIVGYVKEHKDVPYVLALGFRYDYIPGGMPTKELADDILSDRPLIMWSYGGNTGWLNTKADELMRERNLEAYEELVPQIDETTGKPTGILMEFHPFNYLNFFTEEELGKDLKKRMFAAMTDKVSDALKYGVTTFHDVQIYKSFLPYLLEFHDMGGLDRVRARIGHYVGWNVLEDEPGLIADLIHWRQLGQHHSDAHFYLGDSVKLYIEGVPSTHTSLMLVMLSH